MSYIADFHIHSHCSVATSKDLVPEYLDYWARIKGIHIVGTGDLSHPGWLAELEEKLVPAEQGLYRLKDELKEVWRQKPGYNIEPAARSEVRFILTGEISTIYKKAGKVRKVHHLVMLPDFDAVRRFQRALASVGNIVSDGRPILGLDSRNLLEIALESAPDAIFVPAHIWTPWFSVLGEKSGFDRVEDCYRDISPYIHAVETGLSSDPPMNWACSFLDKFTIISNSDAHSPENLGREANVLECGLSFDSIANALDQAKTGGSDAFKGTYEFFPQEGKYHYDGHRKCGIRWNPEETRKHDGICAVCGKPVTVGVLHRVSVLADREFDEYRGRAYRKEFKSLIPLKEMLGEILRTGASSKAVFSSYRDLIHKAGSEFELLFKLPIVDIAKIGGELLAEAISRMRSGCIHIEEGYDGEYGRIRVFGPGELSSFGHSLFPDSRADGNAAGKKNRAVPSEPVGTAWQSRLPSRTAEQTVKTAPDPLEFRNEEQAAIEAWGRGPMLVLAGPGTGKTRTLAFRIASLIRGELAVNPESIVAITFTRKAAMEMKERICSVLGTAMGLSVFATTFHAFGYRVLSEHAELLGLHPGFAVIDEEEKLELLASLGVEKKKLNRTSRGISEMKQQVLYPVQREESIAECAKRYESALRERHALDYDDLVFRTILLFEEHPEILAAYRNRFSWMFVDEYQDINEAQYKLVRTLMPEPDSNLCVIGDPNQAIYGFRGADVRFIRMFRTDYPQARIFHLKKSYRCSALILRASETVLACETSLQGMHHGIKIRISEHPTEKSEAEHIARTIERMIGGLRFFSIDSGISGGENPQEILSLSDFAVLCRVGAQMDAFEKAFADHGIPYQRVGEIPFYKEEPVRSLLRHFGPALSKPDATGKNTVSILKGIVHDTLPLGSSEDSKVWEKLYFFASMIPDPQEFLKEFMLGDPQDTVRRDSEEVALITIHASKGLEFPCVFIPGCEEGIIPYSFFGEERCNMEEERRLLYVGMTRAKTHLFISRARRRQLFGRIVNLPPSRFLAAGASELFEILNSEPAKRKNDPQLDLF